MKRLYILLCVGALLLCGLSLQTQSAPAVGMPSEPTECAWNEWHATAQCAILCHSVSAPNVQVTQVNSHSSNAPIFRNHALEKSQFESLKQQRRLYTARLGDAVNTATAQDYVFALRRILR